MRKMRILFLEDEPTIREVLTEYMKMQDYDVTEAEDGEKALELTELVNGRISEDVDNASIVIIKVL